MLYSSQEPATPTLCITSPGAPSCSLLHFKSSAHLTATPKTLPNKVFSQGCWIFQVSESESDSAHHNSCVWVFSPTPSDSSTPAGCPTTQFNSDTIYLEIASDSTGKGSVSLSLSHTHTHTPDANCKLGCHLLFWQIGHNQRFPWPSPWIWLTFWSSSQTSGN